MKSTLEEVLQYRNDDVIHRFIETWDLPFEEAEDIFKETLKWLWLSTARSQHPKEHMRGLVITESLKLLDEMWHTFILSTQDYTGFCEQYFGSYVHHHQTTKAQYEAQISEYERDPKAFLDARSESLRWQYELIHDSLGAETLVKWYSVYLERYTDAFLMRAWRWSFSPYNTRVRQQTKLIPPGQVPARPADRVIQHLLPDELRQELLEDDPP